MRTYGLTRLSPGDSPPVTTEEPVFEIEGDDGKVTRIPLSKFGEHLLDRVDEAAEARVDQAVDQFRRSLAVARLD